MTTLNACHCVTAFESWSGPGSDSLSHCQGLLQLFTVKLELAQLAHAGVVAYAIEETNYRRLARQAANRGNGDELFLQACL